MQGSLGHELYDNVTVLPRPGTACILAVDKNHDNAIWPRPRQSPWRGERRAGVVATAPAGRVLDAVYYGREGVHQPRRVGAGVAEDDGTAVLSTHHPGQHFQHQQVRGVLCVQSLRRVGS